jgi:hypothetical protein
VERASSDGCAAVGVEGMGSALSSLALTVELNAPPPNCRKRRRDGARVWRGGTGRMRLVSLPGP